MKVIIAGPRDFTPDVDRVRLALERSGFDVTEIVSGHAWRGVDRAGEHYAEARGIPLRRFPAQWSEHGHAAGPIRNRQMAEYADALVVLKRVGPPSRGTGSMMLEAKRAGIPVYVEEVGGGAEVLALGAGAL